jgi:hypothetical protein
MKPPPSKSTKAAGKKRGREEAAVAAAGTAPPMSPPRPDPSREWKKSKTKTEDLLALLNSGFIREKEMDSWRAAAGDLYPMEKSEDEIPMFVRFAERGLARRQATSSKAFWDTTASSTSISTPTVYSIPLSSFTSARRFWGSSPTGSCSGSSSR